MYGFDSRTTDWFADYLGNRSQYAKVMDKSPIGEPHIVVYRRGLFWDPCCLLFIIMTFEIV